MHDAYMLYGNPKAIILIIAEVGEKNLFDHNYVGQYFEDKGILFITLPLDYVVQSIRCQEEKVYFQEYEVALVYFRAALNFK
jgi:hypothetical protein